MGHRYIDESVDRGPISEYRHVARIKETRFVSPSLLGLLLGPLVSPTSPNPLQVPLRGDSQGHVRRSCSLAVSQGNLSSRTTTCRNHGGQDPTGRFLFGAGALARQKRTSRRSPAILTSATDHRVARSGARALRARLRSIASLCWTRACVWPKGLL